MVNGIQPQLVPVPLGKLVDYSLRLLAEVRLFLRVACAFFLIPPSGALIELAATQLVSQPLLTFTTLIYNNGTRAQLAPVN